MGEVKRQRQCRRLISRLNRALLDRIENPRPGQGTALFLPKEGRVVIDMYDYGWNVTLQDQVDDSLLLHMVIAEGALLDPHEFVKDTPSTRERIERMIHIVRAGTVV